MGRPEKSLVVKDMGCKNFGSKWVTGVKKSHTAGLLFIVDNTTERVWLKGEEWLDRKGGCTSLRRLNEDPVF